MVWKKNLYKMRIQTVDIIENLVASLEATFVISNASPDGSNYKLESKCTWWLSIGCDVEIDGLNYTVVSFVINEYIIVSGPSIPVVESFVIPVPMYLHGTLKDARKEVSAEEDKELIYPLVYLHEVLRDRKNTDEESMIDREVDLRIFFINSADSSNWLTDDHYENVIEPMQQMITLFMFKIKWSKLFTDEMEYNCLPLVDISIDGEQEESLFDCNLSGIELRLFAQIREDLSCENKCNCIL